MSFSSIAVEQREKEFKALKVFLYFSVAGSLAMHVALLASGIGNLLVRTPQLEEEPIELTFIEPEQTPEPKAKETPEPKPLEKKVDPSKVLTASSANTNNDSAISNTSTNQSAPKTSLQAPPPLPVKKLLENFQPQTQSPQQSIAKVQSPTQPQTPRQETPRQETPRQVEPEKPTNTASSQIIEPQKTAETTRTSQTAETSPVQSSSQESSNQENSSQLRNTLSQIRDSRASQQAANPTGITGNASDEPSTANPGNVADSRGNGTERGITVTGGSNPTGSNSNTGTGTTRRQRREIAVQPTQPKLTNEDAGESRGSGDGRAACRDCKVKYSDRARRRGAEGRVEVAVDTDDRGRVTNVRLTRSSGDRDLDQEHLRQAREWKLKPSQAGRQGVTIGTEYAIQGSRRYNQVKKQRAERQERQRQQQASTSSNDDSSSANTSRRRRRLEASTNNSVSDTNTSRRESRETNSTSTSSSSNSNRLNRRLRRRTETSASSSESTTTRSSLSNRLRRRSRENSTTETPARRLRRVTSDSRTSGESQKPRRRRRRDLNQSSQPSDSSSRLRNALRRSRESAPNNEGE